MTDAQWNWRAAEGRWTAQENLEHLILVERGVLGLLRRAMAAPLRERWLRLPLGELDGVQTLLLLAGHALRHVEQMRGLREGHRAGLPAK